MRAVEIVLEHMKTLGNRTDLGEIPGGCVGQTVHTSFYWDCTALHDVRLGWLSKLWSFFGYPKY